MLIRLNTFFIKNELYHYSEDHLFKSKYSCNDTFDCKYPRYKWVYRIILENKIICDIKNQLDINVIILSKLNP